MVSFNQQMIVFAVPHVFSRIDKKEKRELRAQYKMLKQGFITTGMLTAGSIDCYKLTKDVIDSKLRAYGYKTFFTLIIGPTIEFMALPLYIFSLGRKLVKLRSCAIAISQFGRSIFRGQMGLVDTIFVPFDILFFGEVVSYLEDDNGPRSFVAAIAMEDPFQAVINNLPTLKEEFGIND